jgi:hypothetical protein
MVAVAAIAVGIVLGLEWDVRYGLGRHDWDTAGELATRATDSRNFAMEIRQCPREHSPWRPQIHCPACVVPPYRLDNNYNPPHAICLVTEDSEQAEPLLRKYLANHDEVSRKFENEAALYETMRQKYLLAARSHGRAPVTLTAAEESLLDRSAASKKYKRLPCGGNLIKAN